MNLKSLSALVLSFAVAVSASAVPAKRVWRTVTQPDGTTLRIMTVGDEFTHFTITDDNKIVTRDTITGQYSYAHINPATGVIENTGIQAYDSAVRPASHRYLVTDVSSIDVDELNALRAKSRARFIPQENAPVSTPRTSVRAAARGESLPQSGMGRFTSDFPTKGKIKGLVILCEYSDVKFQDNAKYGGKTPHQYFSDLLNKKGFNDFGGTGCVTEYFEENSMQQFLPEFTLVGPVTLPRERSYYGGNDAYGDDRRAAYMIYDACRAADSQVNFADYDNDGDGIVDNVFVFYAGQGEASGGPAESVWPHSWNLSYQPLYLTLDGVRIDRYACSNEWESGRPDGVGTFIHEFSHVMGLPDLYCTNGSLTVTPSSWSVLDYGPYNNDGRTPPAYSIFERNAMGWIEPVLMNPGVPATHSLEHILSSNHGMIVQTERPNEFFLFENRQQSGWDKYIPGHGLLIWHVDFNQSVFDSNSVNNSRNHQYVDIIEANNNPGYGTLAGYSWPGTSGNTEFTTASVPAFTSWSGTDPGTPVTNIAEQAGVVSFDVCGGRRIESPVLYPAEPDFGSENTGTPSFVASWQAVDGAVDYFLHVEGIPEQVGVPEIQEVPFSNISSSSASPAALTVSESYISIPDGWTASSNTAGEIIGGNGTNQVGTAAPSFKFKSEGSFIQTKQYECSVNSVSFVYMSSNAAGSSLILEGLIDGRWSTIWSVVESGPLVNKGVSVTLDKLPEGISALRWEYRYVKGSMFIDDIRIVTGDNTVYQLPDYNMVSTSGATSVRVDKLIDGITTYRFRASATDGTSRSPWSDYSYVYFKSSGVDDILTPDASGIQSVVVDCRTVTVFTPEPRADFFDASGRHLISAPVSDGRATVTMPNNGFFIVRAGTSSVKIAVH